MNIKKFKIENSSKGTGIVSIEKENANHIVLLIFRNSLGRLLFQGQFVRNITKFIKNKAQKANKIQRNITVVSKKENGKTGIIKCTITVSKYIFIA